MSAPIEIDTLILGGGVAGLSLSAFINRKNIVIEAQNRVGGLSQSYDMNGIAYDIGPHIIFSKNKEVLEKHTTMIETNKIRRSNQIFHKGRYVKYPFENDLSKLDKDERDYCVQEFMSNPYERFKPTNMLQFFLGTFGEGITRTYLQPYNEKIWKFDPSAMDTQMVDRIPKPPKEDVLKSAAGETTEGYTHQLYFHYPKRGGFQTLVDAYRSETEAKGNKVVTGARLTKLSKTASGWKAETTQGTFLAKDVLNCMPVHELFKCLEPAPDDVMSALSNMLYNSIHITMLQFKKDTIGDHFALYFADKSILFHRLSKLNFFGPEYSLPNGGTTLMAEVTFRPDSYISTLSVKEIEQRIIDDLVKVGFVEKGDLLGVETRTERYAYVIYDLNHRQNTDRVLSYLKGVGLESAGRFAEFEYLNTDGVVEHTLKLARQLNGQTK